jgi:hypothetical protein
MERPESVQAEPRGAALALILAAERLIAAHGSDVVTLKDMNEAARVANARRRGEGDGRRPDLTTGA